MFGMRRREFITLLGGAAAAWPLGVRAQQAERMRRIGVLMHLAADDPEGQARHAAFVRRAPRRRRQGTARTIRSRRTASPGPRRRRRHLEELLSSGHRNDDRLPGANIGD
jgi:hypothetical protein